MPQPAGLGRAIQVRRAELGLKRKEVAERALLSYPYLSELENGIKAPSAKALQQLAGALELSQAELLARADADLTRKDHRPTDGATVDYATGPATAPRYGVVGASEHGTEPWPDDQIGQIADLVAAAVRAELSAWARTTLPRLVRDEVRRVLGEEGLDSR